MYPTLKSRIEALPEPERSARRALYSDSHWEKAWELHAWPHQLAPLHDDWRSWSVIAPPGCGKTTAGVQWVASKFWSVDDPDITCVLSHTGSVRSVTDQLIKALDIGSGYSLRLDHAAGQGTLKVSHGTIRLIPEHTFLTNRYLGYRSDYIWADDVKDAEAVITASGGARQYVFTGPTKLAEVTEVSRAGSLRV